MDGRPAEQVKKGEKSGSFVIAEGTQIVGNEFTVEVGIKAKQVLEGDEALELKLSNEPEFEESETSSATARIENFNDCGIDGLVEGVRATGA